MPKNTVTPHFREVAENRYFETKVNLTKARTEAHNQGFLKDELRSLQQRTKTGFETRVEWLPGVVRPHRGKRLAEEVKGNTVIIYADDPQEALELLRHGFMEWILNQQTKPYRQLINRLISLFEELQYDKKEKTIDALTRLL